MALFLLPGAPPRGEDLPPYQPDTMRDLVRVHVDDLENAQSSASGDGLKLTALFLPDALAYRIAKEYLRRRKAGDAHAAAVAATAQAVPDWKRREGSGGVLLKITNTNPRPLPPPGTTLKAQKRIYTIEKDFVPEAVSLSAPGGKRIPVRLAEPPVNLRVAQVQVKKFWTTADGVTRKGASDAGEPASVGRKPKLSKPMAALLIEEKPVEAELIFKTKITGTPLPTLSLSNLKKYEGPFEGDQLDLNGGRRWDPVEPLEIELRLPASGLEPPRALLQLVDEVRGSAK